MGFLQKLRLRVLAVLVALGLAVWALVSFAALPVLPVIGVAIITAAAMVNGMTGKLAEPVCASCGRDLAGLHAGAYGIECPNCGALSTSLPGAVAETDNDTRESSLERRIEPDTGPNAVTEV